MSSAAFDLENPIIVALDVDSVEDCVRLAEALKGKVGALKVGPRLTMRFGSDLVARLAKSAPVFVDNKYLDIPNTMEAAIRATFEAGATLATVHAWAGGEALERLAQVELELNKKRPFKILVVTILTSFDPSTLPPGIESKSIMDHVIALADLALQSGLTGLVSSAQEVERLRKRHPGAYLVTPGIRLPENAVGDQKRVETPEDAMKRGASAIVVGRPIYEAQDPVAAADSILISARRGMSRG